MKFLKQKYHGLPGLGINGKTGKQGVKAESIYMGYINDFFDGEDISVGTFIYAAKRTFNHPDASILDASTLEAAWAVTQQELKVFPNTILQNAVKNSSNSLTSYINYKTFYYSGTRLTDDKIVENIFSDNSSNASLAKFVELDLTGDFISMSFMLKTADNPENNLDFKQYKSEYDIKLSNMDTYDFSPQGHEIYNEYNITDEKTYRKFDDSAIIYGKFYDDQNNRYLIYLPYDTNDAIYKSSSTAGIAAEDGSLLLNIDYSNYYEYHGGFNYVKEYIPNNDGLLLTDVNTHYAELNSTELITKIKYGNNNIRLLIAGTDTEDAALWNEFYKTSFTAKISPKSALISNYSLYQDDDLLDSENNAFYGVASPVLFNNKGTSSVSINSEGINKISPLITDSDYIQRIINSKNKVNILLQDKNGLNIFYSLNDTENSLFVPSTLSSYYKPGDVLYFYADNYAFNNVNDHNYKNIMYMVVLTEDLMGCTPLQLMGAAQLILPLEIKNFSFNNNRVCNYNNIAILLNDTSVSNNTDKKLALSNKSYIGIADNYTDAPVILTVKDGSIFNNFVVADSNVALNGNVSDSLFNIDVSNNIPVKLNNLNVVSNNITEETNVELYKHIYNLNIKFDSEKFIKPLLDLDLYYDTNNTALLTQTLNGSDYFYDIENLYGYFYGCDIYNSDMKKIQTITSIDKTLTIDLIPDVNNAVYYFQIFASCSNSLKYYSKLTQLTLTYKLNNYYGEEKEIKILDRTYYSSPIGQFSVIKNEKTPTRRTVTERYEIDKIKIELLGLNQHIVKEQKFGNIFFDLTDINAEKVDASLFVYVEDPSIIIDDILFNHKHCDECGINVNNWSKIISIADFTDASVFNIDLSSNLPAFNNSTDICENIQNYIKLGNEKIDGNESKLFNLLSNSDYVKPASMQRSILVTAKYHYKDHPYEYYYENYNIVQPGFKDTRDIPVFELNTHTSIHELESYNSIDNGVLNNQFVTYVDINIKDFKKQWGQFIVDPSIKISMDVSIANIDYDLDWQYNYIVEQLTSRRTFKVILEDIDSSVAKLNNYVKLTSSLFETNDNLLTKNTNNCNSTNGSLNCGGSYNIDSSFILYNTPDNTKGIEPLKVDNYILCDQNFIDIHKNSNLMYNGLQNNIMIGLSDIPIFDDIDTIKLKLSLEMGNPMLANMYFRFVVNHINIKVNIDNNDPIIFTTFVPDTFNTDAKNTYLADIYTDVNTSREINRINYKYISKPIDITFNPLSYTVCPNDVETTYTNIYGSLDKYGIKDQIKKELKFFNSSVYENNPYNYTGKQIREYGYYPFNNLYIKKSYIQDNVKAINVKPVSLWDVIQNTNTTTLSSNINDELKQHNVLDFIEGNKYLSIVYNSVIMSPRIRNDKYCFYYNDNLYPRTKYDQKVNNMPVFAYDTQSIELRDDILINSMDKWNDYYTEYKTFNSEKTYHGVLSLYGNGYTQIVDDVSTDIFNEYVMDLKEVKNQNNVSINLYSGINEVDINPMKQDQPNNKEYFRGFLYDINWEFPYYDNKNEIIPYRIVSPFDNFLRNCNEINDIPEEIKIYQEYYNALVDITDASYGTNMVPSNLLFDLNPRIAYNYENNGVNVLMLRRPSIGSDTDNIDTSIDFKEKYEFSNQLFDLASVIEKLSSPYIIKSNE